MNVNATAKEMLCMTCGSSMPAMSSSGSSSRANAGSPIQPNPSEASRNAELARGKVGVEIAAHCEQYAAAQSLRTRELVRLRLAQLDERELGRDEEAVEQDEQDAGGGEKQACRCHPLRVVGRRRAGTGSGSMHTIVPRGQPAPFPGPWHSPENIEESMS